eukprot:TRINITY_DN3022_c0_g1_i2.p1 TRINITY_DN3022_c0_g1~~TRINITY_DN3022_c0_g1_i2.p1  ORF type:complete len:403 (-),score=95.12 TRINITY_DN3022_c0_g1_i2:58-1266(-)
MPCPHHCGRPLQPSTPPPPPTPLNTAALVVLSSISLHSHHYIIYHQPLHSAIAIIIMFTRLSAPSFVSRTCTHSQFVRYSHSLVRPIYRQGWTFCRTSSSHYPSFSSSSATSSSSTVMDKSSTSNNNNNHHPATNGFRVIPVPILDDNYAYLIVDNSTNIAAVVDPAMPDRVLDAAQQEGVQIDTILTTHHHWDHAGGNEQMLQAIPSVKIVGGDTRIKALNRRVQDGDLFSIGNLRVRALATPGHTTGHMVYHITSSSSSSSSSPDVHAASSVLFTGDTLFLGGCGRFFEGTATDMHRALSQVIGGLKDDTLVYCGHEYSKNNLEFARTVDPANKTLLDKYDWVCKQRDRGLPTVPSTVGEEKMYNPFMRPHTPAIQRALQMEGKTNEEVMTELRARKDKF